MKPIGGLTEPKFERVAADVDNQIPFVEAGASETRIQMTVSVEGGQRIGNASAFLGLDWRPGQGHTSSTQLWVLAVGILARVRGAALVAGSWAALLGLLWLWWSVMFIAKTGRLENPELYLYLVPPAFVLAYAIVLIGCIGIIRTRAPRERPRAERA